MLTIIIDADGAVANPWLAWADEVKVPFKYDKPSGYFAVLGPEGEELMHRRHKAGTKDAIRATIPATEEAAAAATKAAATTTVPPELAPYAQAPATAAGVPSKVLALSKDGVWREARVVERRSTPEEVRLAYHPQQTSGHRGVLPPPFL